MYPSKREMLYGRFRVGGIETRQVLNLPGAYFPIRASRGTIRRTPQ